MSWRGVPVFGLLLGVLALMMLGPALLAATLGEERSASAFAVSALFFAVTAALTSITRYRMPSRDETRSEFATLIAAFTLLPAAAAAPLALATPYLTYEAAFFEMLSMMTTTGATVFERLEETSQAVILWRALMAWFGGFVSLTAAFALMAPRNLGGFEVRGDLGRSGAIGRLHGTPAWAGGGGREAAADRVASAIRMIAPVYLGLTGFLAAALLAMGQPPLHALTNAISILSTSGVQASAGPPFAEAGFGAELVVAFFLVLAATRRTYGGAGRGPLRLATLPGDPEIRLLLLAVGGAAGWIYLRHWSGALDLEEGAVGSVRAAWGAVFTVLSFATTTGVESYAWDAARAWSGLENPALVLMGLAVMGGGIATTAGGVKLLRAYSLFKHGYREMERLIQPSSISGSGVNKRGLRREGAQIAWIFVMLFLVALGAVTAALTLTGLEFDLALAAAVATLSNTGPVFAAAAPEESWLRTVTPEGRVVLDVAMVMGRVELLALVAMLNPDNWR